jgi:tetratricopeptide (TPR) repeat protein
MKQTTILLFFIIAFGTQSSLGCINYYHTVDQAGDMHSWGDAGFVHFNKNFNLELIASKLPTLEADFQKYHSAYMLSDYAVYLMKAGRVEESLTLLIELNKNLPNEYQIVANLGTAYELNGELDSALFYIKRGIEINPNAHEGSEWVHIKVLETKLNQIENPDFLDFRSVLDLSPEQKRDSATRVQLELQIRERFPFSPGPDQIMASLMVDLADCYANSLSIEYAKAFYNIAELYYGADSTKTTPKIYEMIELRKTYKDISASDAMVDGSNHKVTGVPYKTIIDNNNWKNHSINWTEFNIDVAALLAEVDYSVDKSIIAEEVKKEEEVVIEKEPIKESAKVNTYYILILLGLVGFAGITFFTISKLAK